MSTIGLNMIVGPGEAHILNRCLQSFNASNTFDEIIIVNTSGDTNIDDVVKAYGATILHFQWESVDYPYGNFGGAREFARQNSNADKIMWLDSDDVLLEQYKDKWNDSIALIKDDKYADVMMWSMPYAIVVDEHGNPITWFRRERIFDRKAIQWRRPVHELLFPEWEMVKNAKINGIYVTHLPTKPTYASAVRNVNILKHEYVKNPDDVQTRYFLGRDSLFVGEHEQGIALLEGIVSEMSTSYEMLYAIAIELIWFYAYGSSNPRPILESYRKENNIKVESWCRLALSFAPEYAEPYSLLGDTYWHHGFVDAAMRMYLTALKKKVGVGKFQTLPLYDEVPSERLGRVFEVKGMLGMALHYYQKAIDHNPLPDYIERKKNIVQYLQKELA